MLLALAHTHIALWALTLGVFAALWAWDALGFRRDQRRVLSRLSEFERLEASWRMPAVDPWERSR